MEKIMKTSKILNTIAGVLRILLKVAAIALIIILLFLLFAPADYVDVTYGLDLNGLSLELVPGTVMSAATNRWVILSFSAFAIPVILLNVKSLSIVQQILSPMAQGQPFVTNISASIRKLSFFVLLTGAINEIGHAVSVLLSFSGFDPYILFNPEYVASCTVDTVLNLNFLLPFALLYLMSHVFRYGEQLQQLSDETL